MIQTNIYIRLGNPDILSYKVELHERFLQIHGYTYYTLLLGDRSIILFTVNGVNATNSYTRNIAWLSFASAVRCYARDEKSSSVFFLCSYNSLLFFVQIVWHVYICMSSSALEILLPWYNISFESAWINLTWIAKFLSLVQITLALQFQICQWHM